MGGCFVRRRYTPNPKNECNSPDGWEDSPQFDSFDRASPESKESKSKTASFTISDFQTVLQTICDAKDEQLRIFDLWWQVLTQEQHRLSTNALELRLDSERSTVEISVKDSVGTMLPKINELRERCGESCGSFSEYRLTQITQAVVELDISRITLWCRLVNLENDRYAAVDVGCTLHAMKPFQLTQANNLGLELLSAPGEGIADRLSEAGLVDQENWFGHCITCSFLERSVEIGLRLACEKVDAKVIQRIAPVGMVGALKSLAKQCSSASLQWVLLHKYHSGELTLCCGFQGLQSQDIAVEFTSLYDPVLVERLLQALNGLGAKVVVSEVVCGREHFSITFQICPMPSSLCAKDSAADATDKEAHKTIKSSLGATKSNSTSDTMTLSLLQRLSSGGKIDEKSLNMAVDLLFKAKPKSQDPNAFSLEIPGRNGPGIPLRFAARHRQVAWEIDGYQAPLVGEEASRTVADEW